MGKSDAYRRGRSVQMNRDKVKRVVIKDSTIEQQPELEPSKPHKIAKKINHLSMKAHEIASKRKKKARETRKAEMEEQKLLYYQKYLINNQLGNHIFKE